jgi:hypothetical protein
VSTPGQKAGPQQAAPPPQQPAPPQQAQPAPAPRAYPPTYPPTYPPYPQSRPPRRAPPPYEPAYAARRGGGPISPIYGAFGLGALSLSGDVEAGVSTNRVFTSQLDVWLEGGVRLTPEVGIGLYADIGVGDPSAEVRATNCAPIGETCTATTGRVGVLLRRTFDPAAPTNTWLAIGTGFDFGSVSTNGNDGMGSRELFSYSGWEMLRLMGGVDLRSNQVIGVGLYAGVSVGRYSNASDVNGDVSLDRATHTLVEGGIRFTLFP